MADALGLAVNCITVIDLTAKLATTLYTYGREVTGARDDINRVREQVVRLGEITQSVHGLLERHHGTGAHTLRTFQLIQDGVFGTETKLNRLWQDLDVGLKKKSMRRFGFRALKWPFDQREVAGLLSSLEDCFQALSQSLQVDQTSVLLDIDRRLLFESLPHASDAAFDSRVEENNPTCHPQTRYGILADIYQWVDDPQSKNIFWLNGMAGTGKSTISRTVSSTLSQGGCLAASFFFKRGESNRGNCTRFFSTVAYQLALRDPAFAAGLKNNIDTDPDLVSKPLREQCEKLIVEPLSKVPPALRKITSFVIVVDALDECDDDNDIRLLIHLLSGASWDPPPWRLKTFITSRPELPIRLGFGAVHGTFQDLILHEVSTDVVESDLRIFLKDELGKIRTDYNYSVPQHRHIDLSWPGEQSVDQIAKMAVPLFIFAATVCRFVSDRKGGSPETQLHRFLGYETRNKASKLEAIYLPILGQTVSNLSDRERTEALADFQYIVGTIILLYNPLKVRHLANLLDITTARIEEHLDFLHSVLNVPSTPDKPVRLLHLSFRDFLTDPSQPSSNAFRIDAKETHKCIAFRCVAIMDRLLCKDMNKGFRNTAPSTYSEDHRIPGELAYASLVWIDHLTEAKVTLHDGDRVHEFLEKHFLHWTELLCMRTTPTDILGKWRSLGQLIDETEAPILHAFHLDAYRILTTNIHLIQSTHMAVYSSMLMFAPTNSIIRRKFAHEIPEHISIGRHTPEDWDPLRMAFDYNQTEGAIQSLAFSSNNKYLAFISIIGFLSVRDISSGRACFNAHLPGKKKVAFSYDSEFVGVGGDDELQIYNPATGQFIQSFDIAHLWAFSSDSAHLATALESRQISINEVGTGPTGTRFNHLGTITAGNIPKAWMNMTRDSVVVATTYRNHEVEIWRLSFIQTPSYPDSASRISYTSTLSRVVSVPDSVYRNKYADVVLSPTSSHIAVISPGSTLASRVEIYSLETGKQCQAFESDHRIYGTIMFSPDSQMVARDSGIGTINIRNSGNGKSVTQLNRRGTTSIAFSDDLSLMAISFPGSVQLWNFNLENFTSGTMELSKPSNPITWIQIAPDNSLVAVGTGIGDVQIWTPSPYECTKVFRGHVEPVLFGLFSNDMRVLVSFTRTELRVWNLESGFCVDRSPLDEVRLERLYDRYRRSTESLKFFKDLPSVSSIIASDPEKVVGASGLADFGTHFVYGLVGGIVDFHASSGYLAFAGYSNGRYTTYVFCSNSIGMSSWQTWHPVMVCPRTQSDYWQPKAKISSDAKYLIIITEIISIEIWSLTTRQLLGHFIHNLTARLQFPHMDVRERSKLSFPCSCPVFTTAYSDLGYRPLSIVAHVCSCHDSGELARQGTAQQNEIQQERVTFHYEIPLGRIHLHGASVSWTGRDALTLPTAQQPKQLQGRSCCHEQYSLAAVATESEEVMILRVVRDFEEKQRDYKDAF